MDIIFHGLSDHVKDRVGKCSTTKDIQDKIQNQYTQVYLDQEHEDNQKERSDKESEEHTKEDDEVSERNAYEDKEDLEIEGVVDIEVELISSLNELME